MPWRFLEYVAHTHHSFVLQFRHGAGFFQKSLDILAVLAGIAVTYLRSVRLSAETVFGKVLLDGYFLVQTGVQAQISDAETAFAEYFQQLVSAVAQTYSGLHVEGRLRIVHLYCFVIASHYRFFVLFIPNILFSISYIDLSFPLPCLLPFRLAIRAFALLFDGFKGLVSKPFLAFGTYVGRFEFVHQLCFLFWQFFGYFLLNINGIYQENGSHGYEDGYQNGR